jgi:Uri superfamily endonuclease
MWKENVLDKLPKRGVYTLIIEVSKEKEIEIGALGRKNFAEGYYAYTGSALGNFSTNLQNRILRHLRKRGKKKHWHIDFLLADRDVRLETVVAVYTNHKRECQINKQIKKHLNAKILVPWFGASDCKQRCISHLLYLDKKDVSEEISRIHRKEVGKAVVVSFYG